MLPPQYKLIVSPWKTTTEQSYNYNSACTAPAGTEGAVIIHEAKHTLTVSDAAREGAEEGGGLYLFPSSGLLFVE